VYRMCDVPSDRGTADLSLPATAVPNVSLGASTLRMMSDSGFHGNTVVAFAVGLRADSPAFV
jgi:hypothetical protein